MVASRLANTRPAATRPTVTAPNASDRHSRGSANGLEREQLLEAERAKAQERARIARELHDVVAHRVGLMVLHAGLLRARAARGHRPQRQAGERGPPGPGRPAAGTGWWACASGSRCSAGPSRPARGPTAASRCPPRSRPRGRRDLRSGQEDQGRAGRRRAAGPLGAAHDPRVGRRHRGRRGSRRRRRGGGAGPAAPARGGAHGHPHAGHGRPGRDQGAHRPARPAKDHHADHLRTGRVRPHGAGERRCRVPPEGHPAPATSSRPSTQWPRATPRSPSSCS